MRPGIALAATGAIGAASAGGAPTGLPLWDATLAAAWGAIVVVAASRRPPWATAALFAPVLALAPWSPAAASAAAGLSILALAPVAAAHGQLLRGALAACAVTMVVRLPAVGPVGGTALLTALAAAPALIGAAREHVRWPSPARPALVAAVLVGGGATAVVGLQLQAAAADARAGHRSALTAIDLVESGERDGAGAALTDAASRLRAADRALGAPWLQPLRLVPIVGPNLGATRSLVTGGLLLSQDAASTLGRGPLDHVTTGGTVDLEAVDALRPALARLERQVGRSRADLVDARSPWLVPPVAAVLESAVDRLEEAERTTRVLASSAAVLPELLGADSPRRYLVMFANPAEAREQGGIMASYVELTAHRGRLRVTGAGSASGLNQLPPSVLPDRHSYPARFVLNDPERWSSNWTGMVDLASVARAADPLYRSRGGGPIDGVVYIDPRGVAALLATTGPVHVPEVPYPLTSDNVTQFLLVDQYRLLGDDDGRKDLLTGIATATFDRLLAGPLPDPRLLADAFGGAGRGGHLQVETFDDEANRFLELAGLRRTWPEPDGSDLLAVVHANGAPNKLDPYLHRSVEYQPTIDATTGALSAEVTVTLRNTATADLPPYVLGEAIGGTVGANLVHLSIYTPHALEGLEVDGRTADAELQQELGYQRYLVFVTVPPGQRVEVTYRLSGSVDLSSNEYRLALPNQPIVNPDRVTVDVEVRGAEVVETEGLVPAAGGASADLTLTSTRMLSATLQ